MSISGKNPEKINNVDFDGILIIPRNRPYNSKISQL